MAAEAERGEGDQAGGVLEAEGIPELIEALPGRFREHHGFLARLHLDQYDQFTQAIGQLNERIEEVMSPFRPVLDLLDTIPGINQAVAEVIVAETGGGMSRFASDSTSPPGPESAPATAPRPAGPRAPRSAPATLVSKVPWASPPSAPYAPRTPTSRPATNGSPRGAA
ncbi:hypothetical protein SCWH03_20250 [Streptomyces pacificus]|uniref:Transposase IS116/IS110/IS902 family protein n=1 Tax=Streptomyces pacificus TaxID=2705029 RepID=A0A6A0ATW7_9ACTN|nr:hypothetical protein [Streptomyces pacificus]GFH35803.1 hypothetical protein SCWH03_20250 [Streptomyces pacificus]